MFRALDHLRRRLEDRILGSAWPSIDKRVFSIVIVQLVHDLWITLHHWEENAVKVALFYRDNGSILQIDGAAPFNDRHPTGIDASLYAWVNRVARRFPNQHLEITNAFRDTISQDWDHIFARLPSRDGPNDPQDMGGGRRQRGPRGGDSNNPNSRGFTGCIFEKVPGNPDVSRANNNRCARAIAHLPTIDNGQGTSVEICFNGSCKGFRCMAGHSCPRPHLTTRGPLIDADRVIGRGIRAWLLRLEVKRRVHLTQEATTITCLRL